MSEQIHPVQAMLDGFSKQWAEGRAATQMTLGELIEVLEDLDPSKMIQGISCELDSYRGYYSDLAIYPSDKGCNVGDLLERCREAMGECFEGYKGGGFYMTANTPIWLSFYGESSGDRLMRLDTESDPIVPVIEKEA